MTRIETMRPLLPRSLFLASILRLVSSRAYAADPASPDVPVQDDQGRRAIDRTWLYADDGRIPAPLPVVGTPSTSYPDVGSSPFRIAAVTLPTKYRAFDANTAQPGVMFAVGG